MAESSGEKEKVIYNPIHTSTTGIGTKGERAFSGGVSTTKDGDQATPQSMRADINNMDELIQRLSTSTRQETRNPVSLTRRVFMHRREVPEKLLLQYYHFENPQVVTKEAPTADDTPLQALAKRQQAAKLAARSHTVSNKCSSIFGLPMANPAGQSMVLWSILLLIVDGIYTALWVPVEAAFDLDHDIRTSTGALSFCVGVLLCVDIFLRFHTPIELTSSYMTYMIKQGPSVAHMYVRHGTFVLDVLASVPLVVLPFVVAGKSAIIVVLLLRVLRLVRVYKIINMLFYIQMISVSGASGWRMLLGNTLSTVYTICIMINFSACLWYYVGTLGDEGVEGWLAQEYKFQGPPDDAKCEAYQAQLADEGKGDLVEFVNCSALWFDKDKVGLWLISFYFVVVTLTTVGYGDITPSSSVELVTAMVIMIVGLGLFASILGKIADIVSNSTRSARQQAEVRKKLTDIQQWMADLTLTSQTRSAVLRFYAEDWMHDSDEHSEVLCELPNDVAASCIWDLVHYDLKQVPLFQHLQVPLQSFLDYVPDPDEGAKALASFLKPQSATRGTHLTRQGGPVESIYFLQRGQVEVTNLGETVGLLNGPTVFGEAALLRDVSEPAKVRLSGYRTCTSCMIWKISLEDISHLSVVMPHIHVGLLRGLKHGVFQKLLLLDLKRLELIKLFLYCMKIEASEQARRGLERMQRKMHSAVDMALVTILAQYDKDHRQASRNGQILTNKNSSPRVGGFLPHSMQEEREEQSLPPAGAFGSSSQPSGAMSLGGTVPVGMTATNVMWGPSGDSIMKSAVSTIDQKSVGSPTEEQPSVAVMSDVLEKFEETIADMEKQKEEERLAKIEKELRQRGENSAEIDEGTPTRRSPTSSGVLQSSTLKSQEQRASSALSPVAPSTVATEDITLSVRDGAQSRANTAAAESQKDSLDAPENGDTSSPETPPVQDTAGEASVSSPKSGRKGLKELSFAGAIMQPPGSAATESNSKRLQASNRIKKDTPPLMSKQGSIGVPPVAKDATLNHVFSFPKVVAAADTVDSMSTLEANNEVMVEMVNKRRDEASAAGLDSALRSVQETFNDLLEKMSGSEMVAKAIQDITAYGDDIEDY